MKHIYILGETEIERDKRKGKKLSKAKQRNMRRNNQKTDTHVDNMRQLTLFECE